MSNNKNRFTVATGGLTTTVIATATFITFLPMVAHAQGETSEAKAKATDEVIVTARKVEENLQEVPVAVSVFTEDTMRQLNIQNIDDVARYTPGFSYSQAFGRSTERPVVRGAGNILAGIQYGVESGTAYFIDGQYYSGDISSLDMNLIERVEVVKGPQSAVFGRNSYAGAVNFVTKKIGDEVEQNLNFEVAAHEQAAVTASASGPLTNNLRGSLSVRHWEYGGEFKNALDNETIGDEESNTVSGVLNWDVSDALSIVGRLTFNEDTDGIRPFALQKSDANNCMPGYRSNMYRTGPDQNENQYYCGVIAPVTQATQDTDGTPWLGVERETLNLGVTADYDIGTGTLSAKFAYRDEDRRTGADSDHQIGGLALSFTFGNDFLNTTSLDVYEDTSLELSFSSDQTADWRYFVGVFTYSYERDEFGSFLEAPTRLNSTNEITNQAVFGSVEYDVNDRLAVSFEGRYADEEKTLVERASGTGTAESPLVYRDEITASFDSFSPRLSATYQVTDDVLLYGSYAEGTKPGGLNGNDGVGAGRPTYDEEEVEALEIGAKTAWLEGLVVTNVSAYQNDIIQYQLTTPVVGLSSGNVTSIATNQGDAEVTGLELDLTTFPADNVAFGLNYAWTDAEFVRGCDDFQFTLTSGGFQMAAFDINDPSTWNRYRVSNDGGVTPANDPDNRYVAGAGDCSIAGNKVPITSEHQISTYMTAEFPISRTDMTLFFNTDATYESSKFVQVHNLMETGSAVLVGASVGVKTERWSLDLFGRNLTDEDSITNGTRWFDFLAGFDVLDVPGIDAGGFLGPRAVFRSFRKGRQLGIRLSMAF